MRIFSKKALFGWSMVICGAVTIFAASPATAAPDVAPPAVVSSYVPTATVDVTNGPVKVVVKVRITDETAVQPDFYFRIYSLESSQSLGFSYQGLVSGTLQNGVWQGTTTVPQGAAGGQWMIQAFNLGDTMNNRTGGFIDLRTITVISGSATDVAPPAVVSSYVPTATVDVTNGPVKVVVKVRITDETAVQPDFYFRIYSLESSQSLGFSYQGLVSGTLQNGVWQGTTTVPQGAAGGQWMIQAFNLGDTMNNRAGGFIDLRTITVISGTPST